MAIRMHIFVLGNIKILLRLCIWVSEWKECSPSSQKFAVSIKQSNIFKSSKLDPTVSGRKLSLIKSQLVIVSNKALISLIPYTCFL